MESAPTPRAGGAALIQARPVAAAEPISRRAVLLGLLLIPVNAWWFAQIEYVRYSDNCTTSALFFNCLALLLLLTGLNSLARRIVPRLAFSRGELLTVYVILVVASALTGHDQLQILFTTVAWVIHNATPENGWERDIFPHLPPHLTVTDPRALDRLNSGDASLYSWALLKPWLAPLGWWALFAVLVVWTLYCFMAIFRRQWDRERLNYPIASVPLEMTAASGSLYRSWPFWIAFSAAATIQFVRLAHNLWPAVPTLNIGVTNYSFKTMPFSAAGTIPISSYPFSYGMAYLLPLQLAFSVWFFFWLARLEMIASAAIGFTQFRRFPYVQQQGVGAYFGVALFVLYAARHHLGEVWRNACGAGTRAPPGGVRAPALQEPLPYPLAFWGFIGGTAGLVLFATMSGMGLGTALAYFGIFLTLALTLARLRAELGLPTIELYQVGADDILQNLMGTRAFSARDLTLMTMFFWLHRTHRQLPMPVHADMMRLGHQSPLNLRGLSKVVIAASLVAIVCAFWGLLHVTYATGYESAKFVGTVKWAFGNDPWRKLSSWLNSPRDPDYAAVGAYGFGLGFTVFLAFMRSQFMWWPFHPVGYLVSGSFGLFRLWLPIFLTWLIKSLLLRYGGLEAYRKAWPFFIGLILGEFTAAFARTIIDLAFMLYLPASSGVGGL
jgi:hypothetical protein